MSVDILLDNAWSHNGSPCWRRADPAQAHTQQSRSRKFDGEARSEAEANGVEDTPLPRWIDVSIRFKGVNAVSVWIPIKDTAIF